MTGWKFDFVGACYALLNQTDSSSGRFSQISCATSRLKPNFGQALARHSTITLTMGRYSHVGLLDMTDVLESLPTVIASRQQAMRATGTTDNTADFGCTHPAEINRFQPKSPVSMATASNSGEETKKPRFPGENEAFCENTIERRRWELNPRVTDLQSVALATWLRRRKRAGM